MFLKHSIDPVVSEVVNRVAELVELPANNAEDLQVVHYDEGQEYKPHQDAFDPGQPEYKQFLGESGQRVMTALIYLNDVANGETKWAANLWFREGTFQQPDPDDHVYTRVFE